MALTPSVVCGSASSISRHSAATRSHGFSCPTMTPSPPCEISSRALPSSCTPPRRARWFFSKWRLFGRDGFFAGRIQALRGDGLTGSRVCQFESWSLGLVVKRRYVLQDRMGEGGLGTLWNAQVFVVLARCACACARCHADAILFALPTHAYVGLCAYAGSSPARTRGDFSLQPPPTPGQPRTQSHGSDSFGAFLDLFDRTRRPGSRWCS